jgi:hypothetical protein
MIIEFWKTGENPITCYNSKKGNGSVLPRIPKQKRRNNNQPVIVTAKNGEDTEYKSVVEAARAIGVKRNTLYAVLNGRAKNTTEYEVFKSQINN